MNRAEQRKIINRKDLDYDCKVDQEVIKVLHDYGISQQGDNQAVASQCSIETIKKIRKDVFKSIPDILEVEYVDAEIIDE